MHIAHECMYVFASQTKIFETLFHEVFFLSHKLVRSNVTDINCGKSVGAAKIDIIEKWIQRNRWRTDYDIQHHTHTWTSEEKIRQLHCIFMYVWWFFCEHKFCDQESWACATHFVGEIALAAFWIEAHSFRLRIAFEILGSV